VVLVDDAMHLAVERSFGELFVCRVEVNELSLYAGSTREQNCVGPLGLLR